MNTENKLPQPTTIEGKYGSLLGIMTGLIVNEEIFHTSQALDTLISTFENNTTNETEQFVLDQAQEYKEGPKLFPFGDQPSTPGWSFQNAAMQNIIPEEGSTKIFDLSLPHLELDLIVDALFFFQTAIQESLSSEDHDRFESIYNKVGIDTKTTIK